MALNGRFDCGVYRFHLSWLEMPFWATDSTFIGHLCCCPFKFFTLYFNHTSSSLVSASHWGQSDILMNAHSKSSLVSEF